MLMHHNISVNLMFFLISLSFTLVIGHYTVSQKTGLKKTYEICEGVQFFLLTVYRLFRYPVFV